MRECDKRNEVSVPVSNFEENRSRSRWYFSLFCIQCLVFSLGLEGKKVKPLRSSVKWNSPLRVLVDVWLWEGSYILNKDVYEAILNGNRRKSTILVGSVIKTLLFGIKIKNKYWDVRFINSGVIRHLHKNRKNPRNSWNAVKESSYIQRGRTHRMIQIS